MARFLNIAKASDIRALYADDYVVAVERIEVSRIFRELHHDAYSEHIFRRTVAMCVIECNRIKVFA